MTCALPLDALARFIVGGLDGLILQFVSDQDIARAHRDLESLIAAVIALADGSAPVERWRGRHHRRPPMHDELARPAQPMIATTADTPSATRAAGASTRDYGYYRRAFAGHAMPFAWLDLDLLDENIRAILGRAGSKNVRIASKSVRSVAALRRILAASPVFRGLMCFTAREAAWLAGQGFDDLLMGYPAWHHDDLAAVARATADGAHITLMVDSVAHVEQAELVAREHNVRLPLCLEVDMTLAVPGRTSASGARRCKPLTLRVPCWSASRGQGMSTSTASWATRRRWRASATTTPASLQEHTGAPTEGPFGAAGRRAPGGGSRAGGVALRAAALRQRRRHRQHGNHSAGVRRHRDYRRVRILQPRRSSTIIAISRFQPAAGYAIEIVRIPAPDVFTCLGGGYSASGGAGKDRLPSVYLPAGARLDPLEGAGEVQTPIHYRGPEQLALGDPILMRHAKAGELCERFTHLACIQNGAIVDDVTTYRGDGQCFL